MLPGYYRLLLLTFLSIGCVQTSKVDPGQNEVKPVHLEPLAGCDAVLKAAQDQAIEQMEAKIDLLRSRCSYYHQAETSGVETPSPPVPDYSKTNEQVDGVEEADLVKTDGRYIYLLADKKLQIIQSSAPMEAAVISTTPVAGQPRTLLLQGDRLVVYSSLSATERSGWYSDYHTPGYRCRWGQECVLDGDGKPLQITVFDVGDRTAPRLVRTTTLSGSYLSSRRVNDKVYTVVSHSTAVAELGLNLYPGICDTTGDHSEWLERLEELKRANREKIRQTTLTDWLPVIKDTRYIDGKPVVDQSLSSSCTNFYAAKHGSADRVVSLVAFDLQTNAPLKVTSFIADPVAVYASKDALYIAVLSILNFNDFVRDWYYPRPDQGELSVVHKFELTSKTVAPRYLASGRVNGLPLNQFSLDEYNGDLRIATTTGRLTNSSIARKEIYSTLSVLRQDGGDLKLVGVVDNIAPDEVITAVRFDGPRAYLVTLARVDPLFVIDLATPESPKILSELILPGFSTYMHKVDETHLLMLAFEGGLVLRLFDVSDPFSPKLTFSHSITDLASTSAAAANHLAFNYVHERGLLALPADMCTGSGPTFKQTFAGLILFKVSTTTGFSLVGQVEHPIPVLDEKEPPCREDSTVKRSIIADNFVFSISPWRVKIQKIDALDSAANEIDLTGQ